MNHRSEYVVSLGGLLVGGIVALVASGRGWTSVEIESAFSTEVLRPTGRDLAPFTGAAPLVALAGIVAVLATRRVGRVVVGLLLAATGLGLALSASVVAVNLDVRTVDWARVQFGEQLSEGSVSGTGWPWLVVGAAALIALSGLLVALRGRYWPVMGARYERTGHEPSSSTAVGNESRDVWEALDRGDDPTADEPPTDRAPEPDQRQ